MRIRSALAFCLLTLFLAAPGTASALTLEEFRSKAQEYLDGKTKAPAFIKLCTATLAKDTGSDKEYAAFVYAMRGEAYRQSKDFTKALPDTQKAVELNPALRQGFLVQALTLRDMGKLEAAADALEKAAQNADAEDAATYRKSADKWRADAKTITPLALWQAFDSNEVAAEDAYKNKPVTLKGKIDGITTSPTGYPQISFNADRYGVNRVVCEFDKAARQKIATLKKGQQITLTGKCQGMVMKSVFVRDTQIVK